MTAKLNHADIYQSVTDRMIAQLEAGTAPWVKPWQAGNQVNPFDSRNGATGHQYRGINVLLLAEVAEQYQDERFVTFKQALDLGGHVRKGEEGAHVIFWKSLQVEDRETGEEKAVPFAKLYTVFNVAQCEGLNLEPRQRPEPINPDQRSAELDAAIAATGANIAHGGSRAYYAGAQDRIQLPDFGQFRGANDYYAIALHELTHWTGHASRLERKLGNRFGSDAYAVEELIAEMGAAFLCASLGVTGQLQHAEYLANWLKVLKADKRAIFTAAGAAQRAADFVLAAMAQDAVKEAA